MRFIFTWAALLLALNTFAQNDPNNDPDWSLLITDPNVNVHEVVELFDSRWEGREITPGCGYKPFKRWQHLMQGRTKPDGTLPSAQEQMREFNEALQLKQARSESGNWNNLGPILDEQTSRLNIPGVGRINYVAYHPNDPNIIFCGAPAGGLWRSYDGGNNWVSNTDDLPTLGVSAIAFDHFNPDIVYMGTGDRDANDAPGMGVMRSTDGGLSWEFINTGMEDYTIGDMITDPETPGVVLAATRFGIHRSTDYGDTWTLVSNTFYYKQILFKPGNSQVVYATGQGRFFRSSDNGQSWSLINNGVQTGTRFVIAVTPADPERVYICSANLYDFRAFYQSTDSGESFTEMSNSPNILGWSAAGDAPGGQAWFDLCMTADPINPDRVFVGGIRMKRSDDGGATWVDIQNSFLHVDHHWCSFSPHDGQLYLCNDGGIYRFENQSQWVDISHGIVSGQIYRFGQAPMTANKAISGYQDNGTMEFNGVNWRRTGGADGFECQYDPNDESIYYNSIYYGQIYRTNTEVTNQKFCGNGELGIDEEGAWSTPWFVTTQNPNKMFVGLKNVWRSANIKTPNKDDIVWERISDNLVSNSVNIRYIKQARADTNVVYVSKGNRRLFRSDNANAPADEVSWVDLSDNLFLAQSQVSAIETHPVDTATLYIGFANRVWVSNDFGASFEDFGGSIPDVSINSIVIDVTDNDGIYAGTDRGVYYRNADMDDWIAYNGGLPLGVRVTELEIFYGQSPEDKRLRASTYGRGMWETDLFSAETTHFPATAWLQNADGSSEVFEPFTVKTGFYRHLNNVPVEGFTLEDVWVSNGEAVALGTSDNNQFELLVEPNDFGVVRVVIPQDAALDDNGNNTYASDTLTMLYQPAPDPFGYEGPGGVGDATDIAFWLRADYGVNNGIGTDLMPVSDWNDALDNSFAASQPNTEKQPLLRTGDAGINGFPAIYFDGEDDALVVEGLSSSVDLTVISVAKSETTPWNEHGWIASARMENGFIIHPWKNMNSINVTVHDAQYNSANSPLEWIMDASEAQIYGLTYAYHPESQLLQKMINGTVLKYPSSAHGERVAGTPIDVNYGWDFGDRYGHGKLAEHVIYNRRFYDTHRILVTNYLGVKYGLDVAPELRYSRYDMPHDVAGIGQINAYDAHYDAKGTGDIRVLNANDLNDGEFLLWGHDGSPMTWVEGGYPITSPHVNRVWAYEQTGDVGSVELRVYNDMLDEWEGEIGLIIANDEQFFPGTTPDFVPLTPMGDYYVAHVDFEGSGVFTIGTSPTVGTENLSRSQLHVYPNPAGETLTVELDGVSHENSELVIFDASGRQVERLRPSAQREQIDLRGLAPGWYTLSIVKDGQRSVARFVHY